MPKIVDKKEKKDQILEAAIRIFAQKGVNSTTISDIAAAADIGKGTVYEYFKSKDQVITGSFHFFMGRVEEGIGRRLRPLQDPLEKLFAYFSAWSVILEGELLDYIEVVLEFWAEGVRRKDTAMTKNLTEMYEEFRRSLEFLLEECISTGCIKPVNPRIVASIMLGAFDGLLLQWILDRSVFDMKEAIELLPHTFIEGLKNDSFQIK
jgi:TetR/AcrR family fatty acid metabolism transcriptional regulator